MNQQYILNKVSLNRNTHKTGSWMDLLRKILQPEARRNPPQYSPPREQGLPISQVSVRDDFMEQNHRGSGELTVTQQLVTSKRRN